LVVILTPGEAGWARESTLPQSCDWGYPYVARIAGFRWSETGTGSPQTKTRQMVES